MPVTDRDVEEVVRLLCQDIAATLGPGYEADVRAHADRIREYRDERSEFLDRVVGDTQQDFHDLFIHTTWPPCPMHARHPLWCHDGYWVCEQAAMRVAAVGSLAGGSEALLPRHDSPGPA